MARFNSVRRLSSCEQAAQRSMWLSAPASTGSPSRTLKRSAPVTALHACMAALFGRHDGGIDVRLQIVTHIGFRVARRFCGADQHLPEAQVRSGELRLGETCRASEAAAYFGMGVTFDIV